MGVRFGLQGCAVNGAFLTVARAVFVTEEMCNFFNVSWFSNN